VKIAKSIPRLKEIVGVKSLVVALSWGITGAFLPATANSIPLYKEALVFFYIFIQILVNTIIFDTLDVNGDRASGIKTVPLALGLKKTKTMLLAINASFVLWLGYCLLSGVFLHYLVTLAFGVVFETLLILYFFRSNRPRLHAELLVDGEWVYLVFLMRLLLH
jgi:4-hydroxybenzoate polyprenyltransferase